MSKLLCAALVSISVLYATTAVAECPDRAPDVLKAWGPATASSSYGHSLYQPRGVRVLGKPIAYVVEYRDEGIAEYSFRIDGAAAGTGRSLPSSLEAAFKSAYPDMQCDADECTTSFKSRGVGYLEEATLTSYGPNAAASWTGPGAKAAEKDKRTRKSGDAASPVYLKCVYSSY